MLTVAGAVMIVFNSEASVEDAARIASLGSVTFLAYVVLFGEPLAMAFG